MHGTHGVVLRPPADCLSVVFLICVPEYMGVEGWPLFGYLVRLIICVFVPILHEAVFLQEVSLWRPHCLPRTEIVWCARLHAKHNREGKNQSCLRSLEHQ